MATTPTGILGGGGILPGASPSGNPVGFSGEVLSDLGKFITVFTGPENPIGPIIAGIGFLLEILGDIITGLISLFSGRPREEATIQVAQRLMSARNPAAQVAGTLLYRVCYDYQVVISNAGNAWLYRVNAQLRINLTNQGVSASRAQQIIDFAYSRQAQAGAPLEPELTKALPGGFGVFGHQALETMYENQVTRQAGSGKTPAQIERDALKFVYQHADPWDLASLRFAVQPTPQPPPPPPPGGGDSGQGGGGSSGGTGGGQGGQGSCFSPGGDELTDGINCLGAKIDALTSQMTGLSGSGGVTDQCCTNVVSAIGAVADALGGVVSAISSVTPPASGSGSGGSSSGGSSSPPVDLTPVTAALDRLTTAVDSIQPPTVDLQPLIDAVNKIAAPANFVGEAPVKAVTDFSAFDALTDWLAQRYQLDPAIVTFLKTPPPAAETVSTGGLLLPP